MHLEVRRGSVDQNIKYISKQFGSVEYEAGVRPVDSKKEGGKPKELLIKSIKDGKDMIELWSDPIIAPLLFNSVKAAEYFVSMEMQKKARVAPDVRYYFGETGAGKSFRAEAEAKAWCDERKLDSDTEIYRHPGGLWMDGYSSQRVIILDDFQITSAFPFKHALKMLDVYKYQVDCVVKFTLY